MSISNEIVLMNIVDEILNCSNLLDLAYNLDDLCSFLEKNELDNKEQFMKIFYAMVYHDSFSAHTHDTCYVLEKRDAVLSLFYLLLGKYESYEKSITEIKNIKEYLKKNFSRRCGCPISQTEAENIFNYLDEKYEFLKNVYHDKEVAFFIVENELLYAQHELKIEDEQKELLIHLVPARDQKKYPGTTEKHLFFNHLMDEVLQMIWETERVVPQIVKDAAKDIGLEIVADEEQTLYETYVDYLGFGMWAKYESESKRTAETDQFIQKIVELFGVLMCMCKEKRDELCCEPSESGK